MTEALEQLLSRELDIPCIVDFAKESQSELVKFTEEFLVRLGNRLLDETKSTAN